MSTDEDAKTETEEAPKTVTLSAEQFAALMGKIDTLQSEVKDLTEKQEQQLTAQPQGGKPPVFYSGGDPRATKSMLYAEKKEAILSSTKMQNAIDAAITDFKKNPPRRY